MNYTIEPILLCTKHSFSTGDRYKDEKKRNAYIINNITSSSDNYVQINK